MWARADSVQKKEPIPSCAKAAQEATEMEKKVGIGLEETPSLGAQPACQSGAPDLLDYQVERVMQ